jgi:hypothetical protein
MLNQYKTELPDLWESTSYIAEWLGGYLWVTDKVAGEERLTKMTNTNGNNITKGEFSRGSRLAFYGFTNQMACLIICVWML